MATGTFGDVAVTVLRVGTAGGFGIHGPHTPSLLGRRPAAREPCR